MNARIGHQPLRILSAAISQLRCLRTLPRVHHGVNNYSIETHCQIRYFALLSRWWINCPSFFMPLCLAGHKNVNVRSFSKKKNVSGDVSAPDESLIQHERGKQQILLFDGSDEEGQLMTKRQAEVLARESELKLVLVEESSNSPPRYQLLTGKQLHDERMKVREIKKATKKKGPKTLRITSRIGRHDLEVKTSHVLDWLEKGNEVKIMIKNATPDNAKAAVDVFKYVTDKTKETAKVIEAKKSATDLVYNLRPINAESTAKKQLKPLAMDELQEARHGDKIE